MLAAGLAAPLQSVAQQGSRVPVIGMLITHPPVTDPVVEAVRNGLRQYGYEDGRNIKLEVRSARGQLERVPALVEELVALDPDAIIIVNDVALRAVRKATNTIPIVMLGYTDDPVAMGWIQSYSRPGTNVTGLYSVDSTLFAKRLEILREALPGVARVAVLWDAEFGRGQMEQVQRAAGGLNIQLQPIQVSAPHELEDAFATAKRNKVGAVLMTRSPMFYVNETRVAELARAMGLPTMTELPTSVQAGCLLFYGSNTMENYERGAYFVDRLLKGAKVAELPVEQASKFRLIVNLKTARALGVNIPQSILLRADEVIR
jgi:putative ABC transport system substrate-binding protein